MGAARDWTKAGFIGLGTMGAGIARRLAGSGFDLTIWARREVVRADYAARGIAAAASVAELGAACDYVGVCVLDDAAVAEICETLIPAMRSGSLLMVHSTILPASCEALERRCDERGILFLDAPVDGTGEQAAHGEITVMCGGREEAFKAARPILDVLGKRVAWLGAAGSGQRAKIICNSLLAADLGLARAAMQLGDAFGLDRAQLHAVLCAGAAQSYGLDLYPMIAGHSDTPLVRKDLGLLLDAAGPGNGDGVVIAHAARHWFDFCTKD